MVVGLNARISNVAGLNVPVSVPFADKYCNRKETFAVREDFGFAATVRIRCLREMRYGKPWIVFFCDHNDCASDLAAEAVTRALAGDPDILMLATSNAEDGQPLGPYIIDVEKGAE